jgi:predicted protein tyrosine phosphatase
MTIIVCPLSHVETVVAARAPSHLITLLDPANLITTPAGVAPDRHLKLGVNDVVEFSDEHVCPDEALVRRILDFGAGWDADRPLLVHCWAGISRSTATAYLLACERNPDTAELAIATALRQASRYAHPNRRIVALADDMLGRRGRMVDAVEAIGPGEMTYESTPFDLPARY